MAGDYTDLDVYQLAMQVANSIYGVVTHWSSFDRWTLGTQLVRAADSIAANIAEAHGRRTSDDRAYFLHVARGSARETACLLEKARERVLIPEEVALTPNP